MWALGIFGTRADRTGGAVPFKVTGGRILLLRVNVIKDDFRTRLFPRIGLIFLSLKLERRAQSPRTRTDICPTRPGSSTVRLALLPVATKSPAAGTFACVRYAAPSMRLLFDRGAWCSVTMNPHPDIIATVLGHFVDVPDSYDWIQTVSGFLGVCIYFFKKIRSSEKCGPFTGNIAGNTQKKFLVHINAYF